jgi:hypothetical protein
MLAGLVMYARYATCDPLLTDRIANKDQVSDLQGQDQG